MFKHRNKGTNNEHRGDLVEQTGLFFHNIAYSSFMTYLSSWHRQSIPTFCTAKLPPSSECSEWHWERGHRNRQSACKTTGSRGQ